MAVGKLLAQRLQHLLRVADNDATQVLERVFHTARTADAPRYGIGGSTQEMAQALADDGVANIKDEVGRQHLLPAEYLVKMADGREGRKRLVEHDDMTEQEVNAVALEVVGIHLSDDNHRTAGR